MTCTHQAEWLARVLARESTVLPSIETMEQEVRQMKEWKRSWMPLTKARASLVLLHQTHYHDRLLQVMMILCYDDFIHSYMLKSISTPSFLTCIHHHHLMILSQLTTIASPPSYRCHHDQLL